MVVIYLDLIPLLFISISAFLKTSIPIATDGHVESAQISILNCEPAKNPRIVLVVFSVPYNTCVLSELVFGEGEDDGTFTMIFYVMVLYK